MNEADEFLDRVDRTLWAVRRTPNDGGPPVYVKVIPVIGGQYVHVDEPVWMNYEAATQTIRDTKAFYKGQYRTELIPQVQMKNAKMDADQ